MLSSPEKRIAVAEQSGAQVTILSALHELFPNGIILFIRHFAPLLAHSHQAIKMY
jgi:hypothetical protein